MASKCIHLAVEYAADMCVCLQNAERLDSEIIYNRDFDYDYFGFKVRCRNAVVSSWSKQG